jgi:hypothetical protein
MTEFQPSTAWPCRFVCDVDTYSPTVTAGAVQMATDILWALSGRQFGLTTVTLRPTRWYPRETSFPDAWIAMPGAMWPPMGAVSYSSDWYGWPAASCMGSNTAHLPAPVKTVTQVKVDGVALTPVTGYRVDDNRILVRTDGSLWPSFNDLRLDDTQVGTWSVTAQYGLGVPASAQWAIGELACELLKGFNGEDCRLPRNLVSVVRQGVSVQLPAAADTFKDGLTGLQLCDLFISTWNPKHLRARARTYSIDTMPPRRVNT